MSAAVSARTSACAWAAYAVSPETSRALRREISFHSVRIAPGRMSTTRTPCGSTSTRSELLRPSTAYFVAWYQAPSGS